MPVGYCTLEDVRRALRSADLPGDLQRDPQIAVDAVTSRTEWLEKRLSRHWYVPDGVAEADEIDIPTTPKSRADEHDIQTRGAEVIGAAERERTRRRNSDALLESGRNRKRRRDRRRDSKQQIRVASGRTADLERPRTDGPPVYTAITQARRDVCEITSLQVVGADGSYTDWVADDNYTGGVGTDYRGSDWWVQINNGGVSELYLNIHSLDDDIHTLSKAVYNELKYGHEGLPRTVRRAVANWAAADLVEEAVVEIPQNATVYNVDTKAEKLEQKAEELIEVYE